MKSKKMFWGFLVVVGLMGVFVVGSGQALDFGDWNQVWFKVQATEKGKIGDAIPPGSSSLSPFQDHHKFYVVVERFDVETVSLVVTLCTFDGTLWIRQPSGTWPLLTGNPQQFLTLFDFTFAETPVTTERFVIPLKVTASVNNHKNPHTITGASIKSLAGVFLETFGEDDDQYATGSVKFTGSWINPDNVPTKVPDGCRLP